MGDWGFFLAVILVVAAVCAIAGWFHRRERRSRERRVELAAAVAADDDPAFAPDAVRARAGELFLAVNDARDRADREALARLLAPGLFEQWRRRLDELDRAGHLHCIEVRRLLSVEYLGLVNRERDGEDRVTVRVTASLRDYVMTRDGFLVGQEEDEAANPVTEERVEYWTLAKADGRGWVVAAVESDREGRHVLDAAIVAAPWSDEARLADASVMEVAALDKLPADVSTAEVVDLDYAGDARTAALDLSLVDGRWAPQVLESTVRAAVAAWAAAVDGTDRDLLDVATPEAARRLLHPSGDTRLVIRGPRVRRLTIAAIDSASDPPRIAVEAEVTGRRYVRDRGTAAVVRGAEWIAVTSTERWTLALAGPDERPWQIVDATSDGAESIADVLRELAGAPTHVASALDVVSREWARLQSSLWGRRG